MAIASCSVKLISRGQGRSAVAAAAYRSGTKMQNAYDGLSHDYTRKRDITYTAILAPQNSQDWVYDRARLWNQAELTERRGNSRLAREVMIALPRELSQEQNIQLAREYAGVFVKQGMVTDVSVHDKGDGNPHAHIMLTTRLLDEDKFGKKCRDWDSRELLILWREQYAELTNQYLERYGHKERIDARSYAAQGVDQIPTIHLGPYAHRMKQQGVYTERWEINQRIEEQNKELAEISKQIDAYQKEVERLGNEVDEEQKRKQEELEKQDAKAQEHFRPEPESTQYDTLLEHYARAAQAVQETSEALQYRLTQRGIKDLADQEQRLEAAEKMLRQRTQDDYNRLYEVRQEEKPDTPPLHTRPGEYDQKKWGNYDTLYTVPPEPEQGTPQHHPWAEEPVQVRKLSYDDLYDDPGQNKREQEPPSHHPKVEKPEQGKEKDNGKGQIK